ncbi:MAG: hypothetical protein ACRD1V_02020 [Vicinamibacterales bacterium]
MLILLSVATAVAAPATAQDRPFVFSISPVVAPTSHPELRVDFDLGAGESTFRSDQTTGPEQRVSIQATDGRFTFIGRVGISTQPGATYQSWQEGDVLYSLTTAGAPVAIAAGGGVRREIDGTNVLLAHVTAAHDTTATRTNANLLLEHASAPGRDAVDLEVSGGWARDIGRGLSFGAEGVGEDLEGFWNPEEAEGGSRLLIGPSIHLAPNGRKWQLITVGGPMFHPDPTIRSTGAIRDLPPTTARLSYAVAVSFTYSVF